MEKKIILLCMMFSFLFTGCTETQQQEIPEENTIQPTSFKEEKIFGTYDVYDDWVFLEHYSDQESAFYSKKEDITNQTSYISVEYRQNQYTKEQYDTLTSAILYQLKLELNEELYQNLITESFTSKNNNFVFRIEVNDEQNAVKTVQYYIAGEKAHILVQTTDFEQNSNIDETAKNIVESFTWRKITI